MSATRTARANGDDDDAAVLQLHSGDKELIADDVLWIVITAVRYRINTRMSRYKARGVYHLIHLIKSSNYHVRWRRESKGPNLQDSVPGQQY